VAFCLLAGGPGCAVHSVDPDPRPEVSGTDPVAGFSNAPRQSPSTRASSKDWSRTFRERDLDKLIDTALAENPDVRSVSRRIDQANARLVQAGSTLFPQIDGAGNVQRRWSVEGDRENSADLGLLLDWEIDAWGRIRSGRAARAEEVEVAFEDWRTARLLLTAAVAETWFELVEQRRQLELAAEQIEANRTLLDLTRLRLGQGQGSGVAVLQQQEQLQSTESLVPDIEGRIEALELSLETLTGRLPGSGSLRSRSGDLIPSPPLPATGFPSDLLAARPDLRAQQARIVALDFEVGEAIAERLPRFSIGGSIAAAGTPSPENLVGNAIAAAVGPIFDAGSRKAEVERRRSRVSEELDRYTSDFLEAVREVETALTFETKITERVRRQEIQLATARKLLRESQNRFSQGASDYLPVLDALSKVQELERNLLTSQRERLSARVALHRALGGPVADPKP